MAGNISWMAGDVSRMAGNISQMVGNIPQMAGNVPWMVGNVPWTAGNVSQTVGDESWTEGVAACKSTARQANRGEVGQCGEGGERKWQGEGQWCWPPDSGKGGSCKGCGPQRRRVTTDGEGKSERGNSG